MVFPFQGLQRSLARFKAQHQARRDGKLIENAPLSLTFAVYPGNRKGAAPTAASALGWRELHRLNEEGYDGHCEIDAEQDRDC